MNRHLVAQFLEALVIRRDRAGAITCTDWNRPEMAALIPLIRDQGAELWLYRQLRHAGLDTSTPFYSQLRQSAHQSTVQNMRVDDQTLSVISLFEQAKLPWALIKGQARRAATALYPLADARAITDVDLLIPESQVDAAWELLRSNGFRAVFEGPVLWRTPQHRPALIDASGVSVELHTTTAETVPTTEAWRRTVENSVSLVWHGMHVRVPCATELVWQALAHGARDAFSGHTLKAFLNVSAILATDAPIDWMLLEKRMHSGEVRDKDTGSVVRPERMRRWLSMAAVLAGVATYPTIAPHRVPDFATQLLWRGRILNGTLPRAVTERLLEEGTRALVRAAIAPSVPGTNLAKRARRRSSSLVARMMYMAWCTIQ